MADITEEARVGRVAFTGSRNEMLGIILRGYALMIPTIGLYRFWQATWKRRFYWQNTVVDGEPLEYTGTAGQLLLGFFFALAFFLPVYVAFFVLSMQDVDYILIGYAGIAALVWFMMGYAIYRARDFRLSRTLWRGIRFDLKGFALAYALRRFLWSIALVLTLGLIYPWMASSLWRYRWRNTWYGDRRFEIAGNWRAFAAPYFAAYFVNLLAIGGTAIWIISAVDYVMVDNVPVPGPIGAALCFVCLIIFGFTIALYRTRSASRILSTVSLGDAKLTVKIGTGPLFWQFAAYVLAVVILLAVLAIIAIVAIGSVFAAAAAGGQEPDTTTMFAAFQSGTLNVVLLIVAYLVVLGTLGLLAEIILGVGWWKLLANSAVVSNPDSIASTKATEEDRALIGQGLADALNVGAY